MEDPVMEWKNPLQEWNNSIPLMTRNYGLEHGVWIIFHRSFMCRVMAEEQGITEIRTPEAGAEGVGFLFQ